MEQHSESGENSLILPQELGCFEIANLANEMGVDLNQGGIEFFASGILNSIGIGDSPAPLDNLVLIGFEKRGENGE
jgi:hypothetical protein